MKFYNDSYQTTRKPAVAGRFYEAGKTGLEMEVTGLLKQAKKQVRQNGLPQAIIVPHAGYVFSGKVAASGFNQIPDQLHIERVFVLASSHQMHFPGASVYCSGNYETPLGTIEVDKETCRRLIEMSNLFAGPEDAHIPEHSLEVELPFLQKKLKPGFKLIPIILGTQKPEECRKMAGILEHFITPYNLFVISSDFSHYPGYTDAIENDRITTEAIMAISPEKLLATLENNRKKKIPWLSTSLCGWTSVLTLLYMLENKPYEAEWIDYQNSGDQTLYGDRNRVVGYSTIAFYKKAEPEFLFTNQEKEALLKIARNSAREMVRTGKRIALDPSCVKGSLAKKAGAFVSIYISGKLRGCIGSFENEQPLAEVVNRSAASAVNDRRFPPIEEDELDQLSIEISVLTPLKRIYSKEEIIPGKHGIYIRKGLNSGTFLPQVSEKYGWSVDEFLGRCSRDKAGIGWDGWKQAELYTYEAIIIQDSRTENLS